MKTLAGKVCAITGAASGIGRALALELAGQGCALALADVDEAGLAACAAQARDRGVAVTSQRVDVADRALVYDWAEAVVRAHGRVHVVVNNAGVAHAGLIEETSDADLEWVMGINFWGVVHGTRAFLPHLKAAGEGHVVNVSSVFGLFAQPGMGAYNASKFAVRGFTEALRQELDLARCGVSATCVHPGGIRTNIARSARLGASVRQLTGADGEASRARFERALRTAPQAAAQAIVAGIRADARRVLIGADAWLLDQMQRSWPAGYQRLVGGVLALARSRDAEVAAAR